jgi:hypothetical protein
MRVFFFLLILVSVAASGSGCIRKKTSSPPAPTATAAPANAFASVPGETPPPQPAVVTPSEPQAVTAPPITAPPEPKATAPSKEKLRVTPDSSFVGKVATVNSAARFVVLSFPVGRLPALDQRLNVNRRGAKVGEVKITGPQLDENIVADIVSGDAEAGDEVASR